MAQNTEHYNLVKPDYTDPADVSQLNDNMDTIDGILWQLANAGADDELLAKVQEILDKIGETDDTGGSTVAGTVMAKLNTLIDQDDVQSNKLDTVLTILGSGVAEYTSPGNYQLEIPAGITKIKVTACGGGGGGGDTGRSGSGGSGGGGGGAAAVVNQEYTLENTINSTLLNITVGAGGTRNADGKATVVGNLVTLAGGKKGLEDTAAISGTTTANGGAAGGTGGGAGGAGKSTGTVNRTVTSVAGTAGVSGTGGSGQSVKSTDEDHPYAGAGGGGGGSLGNGGNGAMAAGDDQSYRSATAGTRGGGGGGGAHAYTVTGHDNRQAGNGGNGYVKIEWGL